MLKGLKKLAARLRRSSSGNATLIMAVGMPALIGGSGLAVDTAQWYLWKKELQYSVDQAAIAGAWSKAYGSTGTTYENRARQELTANQDVVDFVDQNSIDIHLAGYDGGTDNSVVVSLSATKTLPFTGYLTGNETTVGVYAQAMFEEGATYASCLRALDEDDEGAITIGGSSIVIARCGLVALSNNGTAAIKVTGSPKIDPGSVVAAGKIDDWFKNPDNFTDNGYTPPSIDEGVSGLDDPYGDLTPPDNASARTYSCPKKNQVTATGTYTATITTQVVVKTVTYSGTNANQINTVSASVTDSDTGAVAGTRAATSTEYNNYVNSKPKANTGWTTTTTPTEPTTKELLQSWSAQEITGNGHNAKVETKFYEKYRETTTTEVVKSVKQDTTSTEIDDPNGYAVDPGTYAEFDIKCNTTMRSGVYVIDGGMFSLDGNYTLSGAGVMIVLKNGAGFRINGTSNIILSPMTASQLEGIGKTHEEAVLLENMLVFEDRSSGGNQRTSAAQKNLLNGTTAMQINGRIYLPKSSLTINGDATITSNCLNIVASTIMISGNANYSTFCSTEQSAQSTVHGQVRLVS